MGVLETLKDMYSFSTISSFAGKSLTGPSNGTCAKHTARASWMPGSKLPSYLDGSKPGDYGFDPLGLGEVPANLERFREAELLNARWAMLGVAGCWGVEAGGFGTWQEAPLAAQQTWGGIDLPISNTSTLVGFEILLMAFVEQQRISEKTYLNECILEVHLIRLVYQRA